MPIDPALLEELEKQDPELVRRYRAKMQPADEGMADARKMQDLGNYGNTAGRLLNDFGNSQKQDVILKNRIGDLGKAPTIKKADRPEYDDSVINKLTSQGVDRAREDQRQAESDFGTEQRLTDTAATRGDQARVRAKQLAESDATSPESEAARSYLLQVAPGAKDIPNFDRLSAAQVEKITPGLIGKYNADENRRIREAELRQRGLDRDAMLGLKKQEIDAKLNPGPPDPAKLNSGDKQRFDNANMGLTAIDGMTAALKNGQNTFSMLGDNDFTVNRTDFEEALGRMQSGGAITDDEAARFRKMAPTATDSSEMQQKKLIKLRSEMENRLNTLGFDPKQPAPETKVVGGVTYRKVDGGWEEQ